MSTVEAEAHAQPAPADLRARGGGSACVDAVRAARSISDVCVSYPQEPVSVKGDHAKE